LHVKTVGPDENSSPAELGSKNKWGMVARGMLRRALSQSRILVLSTDHLNGESG